MCYCCQREGHPPAKWKYKDFQCRVCNKKGYLERACRTKESANQDGGPRTAAMRSAERDTLYVMREPPDKGTSHATLSQRSASPLDGTANALGQPPGPESGADVEWTGVTKDFELLTVKGDSEQLLDHG